MAAIEQVPDTLSFLDNLKKYIISTDVGILFQLYKSSTALVEENYYPDWNNEVEIDIHDIVSQFIKLKKPQYTNGMTSQNNASASFSVTISLLSGTAQGFPYSHNFTVLAGGVKKAYVDAAYFHKKYFLKLDRREYQPIQLGRPECLTMYLEDYMYVYINIHTKSGGKTVLSQGYNTGYNTLEFELGYILNRASIQAEQVSYIEVEIIDDDVVVMSQKYRIVDATGEEHHYLFVNSIGGIETVSFTGVKILAPTLQHESSLINGEKVSITSGQEMQWSQNTGIFSIADSVKIFDFLASKQHWIWNGSAAEEIVLTSSTMSASDSNNVNSAEFTFKMASNGRLLDLGWEVEDPDPQVDSGDYPEEVPIEF